jgi:hypothetical protein
MTKVREDIIKIKFLGEWGGGRFTWVNTILRVSCIGSYRILGVSQNHPSTYVSHILNLSMMQEIIFMLWPVYPKRSIPSKYWIEVGWIPKTVASTEIFVKITMGE